MELLPVRSTAADASLSLNLGGFTSPSPESKGGTAAFSRAPPSPLAMPALLGASLVAPGECPAPAASSLPPSSAPPSRSPSPGCPTAPLPPPLSEGAGAPAFVPRPPALAPPAAAAEAGARAGAGAAAFLAPRAAAQAAKEPLVRAWGGAHLAAASPMGSASLSSCCTRRRASPALRTSLCSRPSLPLSAQIPAMAQRRGSSRVIERRSLGRNGAAAGAARVEVRAQCEWVLHRPGTAMHPSAPQRPKGGC